MAHRFFTSIVENVLAYLCQQINHLHHIIRTECFVLASGCPSHSRLDPNRFFKPDYFRRGLIRIGTTAGVAAIVTRGEKWKRISPGDAFSSSPPMRCCGCHNRRANSHEYLFVNCSAGQQCDMAAVRHGSSASLRHCGTAAYCGIAFQHYRML